MKDYYSILGIAPEASEEAISTAYEALVQKHHADRRKGSFEESPDLKDIDEARAVLMDPVRRKEYDMLRTHELSANMQDVHRTAYSERDPGPSWADYSFSDLMKLQSGYESKIQELKDEPVIAVVPEEQKRILEKSVRRHRIRKLIWPVIILAVVILAFKILPGSSFENAFKRNELSASSHMKSSAERQDDINTDPSQSDVQVSDKQQTGIPSPAITEPYNNDSVPTPTPCPADPVSETDNLPGTVTAASETEEVPVTEIPVVPFSVSEVTPVPSPMGTPTPVTTPTVTPTPIPAPTVSPTPQSVNTITPSTSPVVTEDRTFSIGTSEDTVRDVMGEADSVSSYTTFTVWRYGTSSVQFDRNGCVEGWSTGNTELKADMGSAEDGCYFTIGSSMADVVSSTGTPDGVSPYTTFTVWNYGTSSVQFDRNGCVEGWSTGNTWLKADMGSAGKDCYFSIGSSMSDVIASMGTPDGVSPYTTFTVWRYGTSSVQFDRNGCVEGWSTGNIRLKADMGSAGKDCYFSIGSSMSDVIASMGTPDGISPYTSFTVWRYGTSSVQFDRNSRVDDWTNGNVTLKIK